MLQLVLTNEKESNRKLPKMFDGKNLWHKKTWCTDLILKKGWRGMLKIDVWVTAKQKIIKSWPCKKHPQAFCNTKIMGNKYGS